MTNNNWQSKLQSADPQLIINTLDEIRRDGHELHLNLILPLLAHRHTDVRRAVTMTIRDILLRVSTVKRIESIMATAMQVTHGERGFIALFDSAKKSLQIIIMHHLEDDLLRGTPALVTAEDVFVSGQAMISDNIVHDENVTDNFYALPNRLRSVITVPLRVSDSIIGVIYADLPISEGIFNKSDLARTQHYADAIAPLLKGHVPKIDP